jgi:hypothetical protein
MENACEDGCAPAEARGPVTALARDNNDIAKAEQR